MQAGSAKPLTRVAVYQRTVGASAERVWENVHDWAHLPWLHGSSFSSIECLDSGPWGWRARVGLEPAGAHEILLELVLDDAASRYVDTGPASFGAFGGNDLLTLHALRADGRLYAAIEGDLSAGNAFVMYVDREVGGADGAASPTPFADFSGALDRALSKTFFTPAELRVDYAWGTLDTLRAATAGDDRMGWRDVGSNPAVFSAVDGTSAPTTCSATVCETSISLSRLGVPAGANIGIFVRLVSATSDGVSNQTLPTDDPSAPELISVWASLPP